MKILPMKNLLLAIAAGFALLGAPAVADWDYDYEVDYGYYDCYEGAYDNELYDDDWFFDTYDWADCEYGYHYDWDYDYDYDWDADLFDWEEEDLF